MKKLIRWATFWAGIAWLLIASRRRHPARRPPVPGLPEDGEPLRGREWDEWDLIEEFYETDAAPEGRP